VKSLMTKSLVSALAGASLLVGCAGGKEAVKKPVAAPVAAAAPAPKPVEVNPSDIYKRARESLAARDYAAASDALESYLMKEPKSAAANFDAGWVAEQRQMLDKAAGFYKKALEADAGHLGAALNLARVYRLWERYGDAEGVLRAALGKRENNPSCSTRSPPCCGWRRRPTRPRRRCAACWSASPTTPTRTRTWP
jgi:Tfp pilus assembly protein PilF